MNRPLLRRLIVVLFLFFAAFTVASAQETAKQYFASVSERYASIEDYTANLVITRGNETQVAAVTYKSPNLLRLDFEQPAGMVMVVGSELLQVWVPEYSVTFSQPLRPENQAETPNLNSSQGLELMTRYYVPRYTSTPDLTPLDPGSSEMVIRITLDWKSNNEGYRNLELAIDTDKLIRRITGITTSNETVIFDFTDISLNNGIPETRFEYDSPPEGNTIENFLFDPEN